MVLSIDGKADDPHDNTAHTETFAVDGDEQPPEEHGDTEHDDTVPSQSDVDSKADDPHGSESHSSEVVHEGEDATFEDTTHDSVNTDELNTDPTGVLVTLDGDQTVADDTVTTIEWGTEDTRGNVSSLLNASNEVVIPAGFNWAKITAGIIWDETTEMNLFDTRINGNAAADGADTDIRMDSGRVFKTQTAFFSVSENDAITIRTRHQFGSSLDILDLRNTFMEVLLL